MSINYSREITNCQRNSIDIVEEIHVDWVATKTVGIGTTVSAKYLHKMPIAPAGENPIEGVSSEELMNKILDLGHNQVKIFKTGNQIIKSVKNLRSNDSVLIMQGAGNISEITSEIKENYLD